MTRKTIYYISQLADPNIYDTSVFQKCLGGDNEINWINDQLEKLNLLDSVAFKGVSIERGGMLPNISDIDIAFLGGSYHSVHDHFPWQEKLQAWLGQYRLTEKPLFGICGGHQQMAMHLGAQIGHVREGTLAETLPISLTTEGKAHFLFNGFAENDLEFHFGNSEHVVNAPLRTEILATRPELPAMALDYGSNLFSVQFHPEADATIFAEGWRATNPEYCNNYRDLPKASLMLLNYIKHYL